MKSVYLNDALHTQLKFLAAFHTKTMTQLIEEFLKRDVEKALADIPAKDLAKLAQSGKSFDFLNNPAEDIYTASDGALLP